MNEKEQSELKEHIISTIGNFYKDSNEPNPTIAIIGDLTSCKNIANAFGQGNMVNAITNNEDTHIKLEYASVDIMYDKYKIRLIYNDKMNHKNNIYIIPCDRV